ncbi:MAG: ATP-dependent helicase [Candidatus Marsarchaeota archaeon]|nr:ATP-dependent helicase [Candidatus Marsarchaeota archaeon]
MIRKVVARQKEAVEAGIAQTLDTFYEVENGAASTTSVTKEDAHERPKSVLLDSGTGTGKTTQMIAGLVDLLKEGEKTNGKMGARPEDILFITWSREANEEVRERLTKVLAEEGAPKVRESDIEIRTLRSYTSGLMREQAGETIAEISDSRAGVIILEGLRANNPQRYSDEYLRVMAKDMKRTIDFIKGFGLSSTEVDMKLVGEEIERVCKEKEFNETRTSKNMQYFDMFMKVFDHYEKSLEDASLLDQNDILMLLKERMDKGESPYKRYKYVFVDGIQDMNVLESQVIAKSGESQMLVRDDKKAIFGFRGGGVENAWSFSDVDSVIRGGAGNVNKRNLKELSDYAKDFFLANVTDRKAYEKDFEGAVNARTERKGVVQLVTVEDGVNDQVEAAAAIIADLVKKGEKVGVLGRSNYQLEVMEKKLDSLGIHYMSKRHGGAKDAKNDIIDYLKGMLYNEPEIVIKALFTPFAQVSWADASDAVEKYRTGKITWIELQRRVPSFFANKATFTRSKIEELFGSVVIPIAVGQGEDYHKAALAIQRSLLDYTGTRTEIDRTSLFDHLEMSTERSEPAGKGNGVLLATVHGAKSKWFDTVVYLPSYFRGTLDYPDITKYAIMKATAGIDTIAASQDEPLKVDFVAITRARNELYIISSKKQHPWFNIPGKIVLAEPRRVPQNAEAQATETPELKSSARGLKSEGQRIKESFFDHFAQSGSVSFTQVETSSNPFRYVFNYIYKSREQTTPMKVGAQVHEIAERFFRKTLSEGSLNETEKRFLDNIKEVYSLVTETYGVRQTDAEYNVELDINEVFEEFPPGTRFKGKIDAVYEKATPEGTKYILLDYKTDKDGTWFGGHEKQVALYKRAFAIKKKVREEDIDVIVAFIGRSQGGQSFGMKMHSSIPARGFELMTEKRLAERLEAIKEDTKTFLDYRNDPNKFIDALLHADPQNAREKRLREALLADNDIAARSVARIE